MKTHWESRERKWDEFTREVVNESGDKIDRESEERSSEKVEKKWKESNS